MANMIVLVSDQDDAVRGEITVLDGPDQAARLVENLLESGFEQERIRVFVGDEMQMQVHHRPVVSLTGNATRTIEEESPSEEAALPLEEEEDAEGVDVRTRSLQVEEIAAKPYTRNGVRFSSLFRGT